MTDFLLVHGAWHGGWCWRPVAEILAAHGHRVVTPTLTGQGDRAHLLTADTDLLTHAQDVQATLDTEELQDVILVGHSYGARPALLATAHPAVRHWVSLDGVAVVPGTSLASSMPPDMIARTQATLIDGRALPPLPAAVLGVPADHPRHAWVSRRLTPMAWRALTTDLPPWPARFAGLPKTYVTASGNRMDNVRQGLAQARAEGWPVREITSGHELMITAAEETAAILLECACG